MDLFDVFAALSLNVLSHLLDVHGFRHAFHHDDDNVLDYGDGCNDHNDGEKVGADRVEEPPGGDNIDDDGGDNDTDTHDNVTEDVQERCIYYHV